MKTTTVSRVGSKAAWLAALLFGLATGPAPRVLAQEPDEPRRSVYGSLQSVDADQRAVVMVTADGERLAWRVGADVLERIREFQPGAEMIVIYRQTRPDEKVATAIAFPGTASSPTYVNTTRERVVLRSGPRVDGVCHHAAAVNETPILPGGQAETADACWCCAPDGATCEPSTQTGSGQAFLLRCF